VNSITLIRWQDAPLFLDHPEYLVARNRRVVMGKGDPRDLVSMLSENFRLASLVLEARAERDNLTKQIAALLSAGQTTPQRIPRHEHDDNNRSRPGNQLPIPSHAGSKATERSARLANAPVIAG